MIDEKLIDFLCEETALEDMGDENLLHNFPAFGETVGQAINSGNLLEVSIELSSLLEKMDLYKACLISHFIGFACEKENNTAAGHRIIKLFSKACDNVYEMLKMENNEVEGESHIPSDFSYIYEQHSDWVKAYYGFETICIVAMSFLTRDVELRMFLRNMGLGEKINYLAEDAPKSPYLKSVYYVNRMQKTCTNLKLLVIFPEQQHGFLAIADDLDNCFHLIFLLEEQIAKTFGTKYDMCDFKSDEALIKLAHGEYPVDYRCNSYRTYFMEYNYGALKSTDINYLIWGEMPPEAIPEICNYAVIVLQTPSFPRSFDVYFLSTFHTVLRPSVSIERELTNEEYNMWINRIQEAL